MHIPCTYHQALVKQPRNVMNMESTIAKLEAGDLKLRVRALEVAP